MMSADRKKQTEASVVLDNLDAFFVHVWLAWKILKLYIITFTS